MFLWGAQLEQASTATDYTRNVGGLFPARFDYDPVTLAPRGILIEEQRVNLLLRSEELNDAAWTLNGATVTANATTSPSGTASADKVVENNANTWHGARQVAGTGTVGIFSFYAKAAERSRLWVGGDSPDFAAAVAVFNLSDGTVQSGTGTITPAGSGWYRCSISTTVSARGCTVALATDAGAAIRVGDGVSGAFIWGAQLEAGAFATSYIPTVASQVTRTADQASIVAPMFAPWYNQSAGTLVVEVSTFKPTTAGTSGIVLDANDGTLSNRNLIVVASATVSGRTVTGGVTEVSLAENYAANAVEKLAYAFQANNFAFARNGALVGTDTSGSIPTVNRLDLGGITGSAVLNGHIRRTTFYPVRLSDLQLQALTA
jgi:hypothetical protein